jgi:pyruvate formate lyase activating enzyme
MEKVANFWKKIKENKVKCSLCSHNCEINDGKLGICGVRRNENGKLYSLIYGSCSSIAADPIEKKPLYHFFPGTNAFSMGSVGCNFKCNHCQNFSISTAKPPFSFMKELKPEQVVELARNYSCQGVAYTYNEPTIWHEFCYDSAKLVKNAGLYTCYVSNGYISEDPLREISLVLDAINVDVKAFREDFYKKVCKARLEPVLRTCALAKELNIHLELTYLVIPDYNDSEKEIKDFCRWIVEELGENVPVHFSRFHPDYKMNNVSATPIKTLFRSFDIAKETGILFPYIGNIINEDYENTICPKCGNICIKRKVFSIDTRGLKRNKCVKCNNEIPIVINNYNNQKI